MILSAIAFGAHDPVTGQPDFIPMPCQEWAARTAATAEGIPLCQPDQVPRHTGTLYPNGSKSLTESAFRPASVLSEL